MTGILQFLSLTTLLWVLGLAAAVALAWWSGFLRYIPNNRIGVVEKLWSAERLGEARASSPSRVRPASSPTSCAAAGTSSRRSSTGSTSCRS